MHQVHVQLRPCGHYVCLECLCRAFAQKATYGLMCLSKEGCGEVVDQHIFFRVKKRRRVAGEVDLPRPRFLSHKVRYLKVFSGAPENAKKKPDRHLDPIRWAHKKYKKAIGKGGVNIFCGRHLERDGEEDVALLKTVIVTESEVQDCPE